MPPKKPKTKRPCQISDKTNSTKAQHEIPSKILELPKELLVHIIALALVSPKPITLREPQQQRWNNELANLRDTSPLPRIGSPQSSLPAARKRIRRSPLVRILLVSKEFYFAGTEAFYSQNTFHFDDVDHFLSFKERLGQRQRACLRKIVVDAYWRVSPSLDLLPWTDPRSESRSNRDPSPRNPARKRTVMDVDALEGLPRLESATVESKLNETCYWFAAASKAEQAKRYIREKVLGAWKSQGEVVRFEFPEDWGRVKDK